jgi:pimeloyl-ACP methyl ester carboxylesterase
MSETSMLIGPQQHLVATYTSAQPERNGEQTQCVALLTNSGVIPRAGPHRMNVHLARRFASLGISSIRFDMSGLGDSLRTEDNRPMIEQWVSDTRLVMDDVQQRTGVDKFFMVGFCSGAEVAHLTAMEDARLRGIVLWDLYAYPTVQSRLRVFAYRLQRAGALGAARKALARVGLNRSFAVPQQAANIEQVGRVQTMEASTIPSKQTYAKRLRSLVDRGVAVQVLQCGGEPEWYNHHSQFAQTIGRLGLEGKIDFDYLKQSDHLLTRQVAQDAFVQVVTDWLIRRGFAGKA